MTLRIAHGSSALALFLGTLGALPASPAHAAPPDGGAPHRLDLFPSSIGVSDAPRPPLSGAEVAAAAAGVERVRSGMVPPDWRSAERAVSEAFHPSVQAVATGSAPQAMVEQALANRPTGPARTRGEPQPDARGALDLDEQVDATHRAMRRGRNWKEVEIEVRLTAAGTVESLRVVLPSGSADLDEAALQAVSAGLARAPVEANQGLRVGRLRLSAARAVKPLDVAPVTGPDASRARPRGIVPKARFQFDEVKGTFKAERPYSQEVQTEVSLVSLVPAAVPTSNQR